jgi:hypothetical protein
VNLAVPSIRYSAPARVGDPEPRNLDHAPTGPLPPQCRGRKTGADKPASRSKVKPCAIMGWWVHPL